VSRNVVVVSGTDSAAPAANRSNTVIIAMLACGLFLIVIAFRGEGEVNTPLFSARVSGRLTAEQQQAMNERIARAAPDKQRVADALTNTLDRIETLAPAEGPVDDAIVELATEAVLRETAPLPQFRVAVDPTSGEVSVTPLPGQELTALSSEAYVAPDDPEFDTDFARLAFEASRRGLQRLFASDPETTQLLAYVIYDVPSQGPLIALAVDGRREAGTASWLPASIAAAQQALQSLQRQVAPALGRRGEIYLPIDPDPGQQRWLSRLGFVPAQYEETRDLPDGGYWVLRPSA
jgi:hypothetical protein